MVLRYNRVALFDTLSINSILSKLYALHTYHLFDLFLILKVHFSVLTLTLNVGFINPCQSSILQSSTGSSSSSLKDQFLTENFQALLRFFTIRYFNNISSYCGNSQSNFFYIFYQIHLLQCM